MGFFTVLGIALSSAVQAAKVAEDNRVYEAILNSIDPKLPRFNPFRSDYKSKSLVRKMILISKHRCDVDCSASELRKMRKVSKELAVVYIRLLADVKNFSEEIDLEPDDSLRKCGTWINQLDDSVALANQASPYVIFGRVAYSSDDTEALTSVEYDHLKVGDRYFVYLKRTNGAWLVKESCRRFVKH